MEKVVKKKKKRKKKSLSNILHGAYNLSE